MKSRTRSLGLALLATVALSSGGASAAPDDPTFTPKSQPHTVAIDRVEAMRHGLCLIHN